jgi:hypothetical protein
MTVRNDTQRSAPIKTLLGASLIAFAAYGPALACPSNPGPTFPGAVDLLEKEAPTGPVGNQVQIEIDGLTALGSAEGDSCAVAPSLPGNLVVTAVTVVNSKTGGNVGFLGFRADAAARRGFCDGSRHCQAFVGKLETDLKPNTPVKVIIEAASKEVLEPRHLAGIARGLAVDSAFALGGVDGDGNPHHHLSVIQPGVVNVHPAAKHDATH